MSSLTLPGFDIVRDSRSLYGDPSEVFIDSLPRFPEAVVQGVRRELERLQRAGIPAFADGRRLWTPTASHFVNLNGVLSRPICSIMNFDDRARYAARRMDERSGFSFNRCFRDRYLKEDQTHA
ncbi:MAG TPA: hypothetical protein PLZ36_03675 [Armatimonadota bacterium]|mgnify:CR=1 FL=1|nr:hypothetical protein [Armatimonadota bacterium]